MEDLKSGISRVRNRVVARVFHELQLMETWGSGYKRCIEDCKNGNYPMPEWVELGTAVRVTFYPHQQTLLKESKETSQDITYNLSERQKIILTLFQPGKTLSSREISKLLIPSISERTLRYDLVILRDKKLLYPKGKGRAMTWQLIE